MDWLNRGELYFQFWTGLLARLEGRTRLFAGKPPARDYYLSASAGKPGVTLGLIVSLTAPAAVEVLINTNDKQRNKAIFDTLYMQKAEIEAEMDKPLMWMRMDNKRASKIRTPLAGRFVIKEEWAALQETMIETLIRLDAVCRPRLARIDL